MCRPSQSAASPGRAGTRTGEPAPGLPDPGTADALERMVPATETMGRSLHAEGVRSVATLRRAEGKRACGWNLRALGAERVPLAGGLRGPFGPLLPGPACSAEHIDRLAGARDGDAPPGAALAFDVDGAPAQEGTVRPSGCLPRHSEVRQAETSDIAQPFRISMLWSELRMFGAALLIHRSPTVRRCRFTLAVAVLCGCRDATQAGAAIRAATPIRLVHSQNSAVAGVRASHA